MRQTHRPLGRSRILLITTCLVAGTLAIITACREVASVSDAESDLSTSTVNSKAVRYTPAELHAKNPMDWVGVAHNLMLAEVITEWKKPNTRFRDLCARLQASLDNPQKFQAVASQLSSERRQEAKAHLAESDLCARPRSRGSIARPLVVRSISMVQQPPPDTLLAIFDNIEAALDEATDPTDLAARLSPALEASLTMSSQDSLEVQTGVAVAQNSYEHWYANSGAAYDDVYSEAEAEIELCYDGEYENEEIEVNGQTYRCQNSDWYMIRFRRSAPAQVHFRLVATTVTTQCGMHWVERTGVIGVGDFVGAVAGWRTTRGAIGSLIGALGASLGVGIGLAYYEMFEC